MQKKVDIKTELALSILYRLQSLAGEIAIETGHSESGLLVTFARLLVGHIAANMADEKILQGALDKAIADGVRYRKEQEEKARKNPARFR